MGGCRCIFLHCPVNTDRNPGMHFFHFPKRDKNTERFIKWVQYSNAQHILDLDISQQKNKVICGRHFSDLNFMNYKKDRLVATALPTIHRLDEVYALDYAVDANNPVLIKLAKPTAAHLIAPEDFPDPLCLNEKDRKICAEIVEKYEKTNKTTSKSLSITTTMSSKRKSYTNASLETCPKKLKLDANDILSHKATDISIGESEDMVEAEYVVVLSDDNAHNSEGIENENISEQSVELKSQMIQESQKTQQQQQFANSSELLSLRRKLKSEKVLHAHSIKTLNAQLHEVKELLINETKELESSEKKSVLLRNEVQVLKSEIQKLNDLKANYEIQLEMKNRKNQEITNEVNVMKSSHKELQQRFINLQDKYNAEENKQQQQKQISSSINVPIQQQQPTKQQLFNGIKKYLSQNMIALLRIQLASDNAERDWKPDERHLAVDLLNLGEQVYNYFRSEWLIRLPPLRQVHSWSEEATSIGDEEEI